MARRPSSGSGGPPEPGSGATESDPVSVARSVVLRQLTAAPRSRAELERALARRGVPQDAAAQVLDRFTDLRLVDDAAYAEILVRSRHLTRGLARRGLAHELRAKGIEDATAAAALDQLDPEQEVATARALVARRLASTARLEPEVRLRRLAGMLARKGYPQGLAVRVVREALSATDDAVDGTGEEHGPLDDLDD